MPESGRPDCPSAPPGSLRAAAVRSLRLRDIHRGASRKDVLRPVVLAHTGQAIRYDGVEMSLSGARAIQPRSLIAVAIPPAIAPACNESHGDAGDPRLVLTRIAHPARTSRNLSSD